VPKYRSARWAGSLIVVCLIVGAIYYLQWDRAPANGTNRSVDTEGVGSGATSGKRYTDQAAAQPLVDPAEVLRLAPTIPDTAELLTEEAITACERLVEAFPDHPRSHALLAVTLEKFGRKRDAKRCWEDVLKLDGEFVEAWLNTGAILSELGQYEQAEEFLRKAIELEPTVVSAYHQLTGVLLQLDKADEALEFANEGVRRFPENCRSHYWLGLVYSHRKEYQQACDHLKRAVEIDPEFSFPYFPLAMACMQLGQTEQADEYRRQTAAAKARSSQADRARTQRYDDDSRHRYITGQTHLLAAAFAIQFEAPDLAEAYMLRAVAVSPDDPACLDSLAHLYRSQGRLAFGVRVLDELARSRPQEPSILVLQGEWLAELSNWTQAEETLKKAAALDPACAEAHFLLARIYLTTNSDLAAAELHASKMVDLAPTSTSLLLLADIRRARGDHLGASQATEQAQALQATQK